MECTKQLNYILAHILENTSFTCRSNGSAVADWAWFYVCANTI